MVLVLAGLFTEKEKYVYNNTWQSKSCHRYFREKGKRKEQKEKTKKQQGKRVLRFWACEVVH